MIRLEGGPANGVLLALSRAPIFLRVVQGPATGWDGLDQPDDQPEPGEQVYVYRRASGVGDVRLQMTGPGGRGRRCLRVKAATYGYHPQQPPDDMLRDAALWQEWAMAEHARLKEITP